MAREGVPVVRGHGLTDVRGVDLGPWARLGGSGAFIDLPGMEGLTGMYVVEVPPGGGLEPERHLYDELMYVLNGRGTAKVWSGARGQDRGPVVFEWQEGSLFAPPLNTWHQLFNAAGSERALLLGVTLAPPLMDLWHNIPFIFNCDHDFVDRFDGRPDFFEVGDRSLHEYSGVMLWETNFIPDVRGATLDAYERIGGPGHRATSYQMGGNVLVGHMAESEVGHYRKAHFHAGGAILLTLRGAGYTLMWPVEVGTRPYQSGQGDRVVRVDWREGSVVSPPGDWFHQHFPTAAEPTRQVALRMGSKRYGVKFHDLAVRDGVHLSMSEGGTLIEYEQEDPEIERQFRRALVEAGVEYRMPPRG